MSRTHTDALKRKLSGFFHEGLMFYQSYYDEICRDYDYKEGDQLTDDEKDELVDREQPPIQFNMISVRVDSITGTEQNAKLDIKYRARGANDSAKSDIYQAASKYVEDENDSGDHISTAFEKQVTGGIAGYYCGFGYDAEGPRVVEEEVDWKELLLDPHSKRYDYSDARFLIRRRWFDVEDAVAMFPEHAQKIRLHVGANVTHDGGGTYQRSDFSPGGLAGDDDRPFRTTDTEYQWFEGEWIDRGRQRVLISECYYRVNERRTLIRFDRTEEVEEFDPRDPTELQVVRMATEPYQILRDAPVKRVRVAMFAGPLLLEDEPSPYQHNRFPIVLFLGDRKHRTNCPFGKVRQMRDPQDVVNISFSKMMYAMGTQQVWYEIGTVMDANALADQANDPGARIECAPGSLSGGKIQRDRWETNAQLHRGVLDMANTLLGEGSGTTEAWMGQHSNETSGRAIQLRQSASGVTLAGYFKRYRSSLKQIAQIRIACIQQAFSAEMFSIITDQPEAAAIMAKDLSYIPDSGEYVRRTSMGGGKVDVVVDTVAHESGVRQQFAQELMQLISRLPDQVMAGLIDIPVDLADPPRRDEIVQRIRMVQQAMGFPISGSGSGGGNNGGGSPRQVQPVDVSQPPRVAATAG